jgi:phytoene desaturase
MLLARAGVDVQIVEKQPFVGGRTSAVETDDGYRFDRGPTFFLYPQVLAEIFRAVGRDLFQDVPMLRLDPQYRLLFGAGGQLDATPNIERMRAAVAQLSPADADAVPKFMAQTREKFARFKPALQSSFDSLSDVLSWSMIKLLPVLRPWASVDQELQRYFQDPRLRLAFSFQSKYLGMSPFRCPSLFSILSFLEYEYGVWHPLGGCHAVSHKMAEVAEDLGVKISLGEGVEELLFTGDRATGVRTASDIYEADAVVINADFARAMTKLVPDRLRKRWTNRKLAKKKFSCSTFMLYLGLEGRYEDWPHHTIYIARDYERNLREIETEHVLSSDPSVYVHNPSILDPSLAPPGHSSLYVLVPVTHQHANVDWERERAPFRAQVLQQLERLGLADLRQRIRYEKILTPADWDQGHDIHLGATFNLTHSLDQMLHLRPHNRFEDLPGVYLVGGGTHPGSGLPVIYESARISSRLLLQDLGYATKFLEPLTEPLVPPAPVYAGAM